MITLADFYKGRDAIYPDELTDDIQSNAMVTVGRVNELLATFEEAMPNEADRTVNSGWRPPQVNATVPGAAPNSKHCLGEACDISDDDGTLDAWCMSPDGQHALQRIGLWLESPDSTPRWCHVQTVPPASGNRVFRP